MRRRFLDVNYAYRHPVGYNRDEFLNMKVQDVEAAGTLEKISRQSQKAIQQGYDRFENKRRRKDGKIMGMGEKVASS